MTSVLMDRGWFRSCRALAGGALALAALAANATGSDALDAKNPGAGHPGAGHPGAGHPGAGHPGAGRPGHDAMARPHELPPAPSAGPAPLAGRLDGHGIRHAVAYINDPLSHGLVGDAFLSLNEVIQLHNRTLTIQQLSLAEQNQISGLSLDVAWGDIDAANIPIITVERDLDVIIDMPHGLLISGTAERPVIDFTAGNVQHGFRCTSDFCSFGNLILHGGPYGIDLRHSNSIYGSNIRDVDFENHSQFGLRVTVGASNGRSRVLMENCRFDTTPTGITFDERGTGSSSTFFVIRTRMLNVATGLECLLGTGGQSYYEFDQLEIAASGTGLRIARPNGADRRLVLSSVQLAVHAALALEIAGAATNATLLTMRMPELRTTVPGGTALQMGPLGSNIAGDLEELRAEGNVAIQAGGGPALTLTNARIANGAVQFGNAGNQLLRCVDTRFDACTISTTGTAATHLDNCCVLGGAIQGTTQAPAACSGSFLQSTVGANVTQTAARPAAQLGLFRLLPTTIGLGVTMNWQADLPAGLFGVFFLGLSQDPIYLALQPYPLHVYAEPASIATIPGIYRLQQGFQFRVPNNPYLGGMDLTAQMAVLPDPGVQAPWVNLPPGRRFVLQ